MRLVDVIVRQGHLSDQALTESVLTGERPDHLNRCDLCAERTVELARWLDGVRATAQDVADAEFPAERLAAQQTQILRRIEQADEPSRVLAFPAASVAQREASQRRVAPVWVGLAAAAGVVLGVVGTQLSNNLTAPAATAATPVPAPAPADATPTDLASPSDVAIDWDRFEQPTPGTLRSLDDITPTMEMASAR